MFACSYQPPLALFACLQFPALRPCAPHLSQRKPVERAATSSYVRKITTNISWITVYQMMQRTKGWVFLMCLRCLPLCLFYSLQRRHHLHCSTPKIWRRNKTKRNYIQSLQRKEYIGLSSFSRGSYYKTSVTSQIHVFRAVNTVSLPDLTLSSLDKLNSSSCIFLWRLHLKI